jgi:hypothetical protein
MSAAPPVKKPRKAAGQRSAWMLSDARRAICYRAQNDPEYTPEKAARGAALALDRSHGRNYEFDKKSPETGRYVKRSAKFGGLVGLGAFLSNLPINADKTPEQIEALVRHGVDHCASLKCEDISLERIAREIGITVAVRNATRARSFPPIDQTLADIEAAKKAKAARAKKARDKYRAAGKGLAKDAARKDRKRGGPAKREAKANLAKVAADRKAGAANSATPFNSRTGEPRKTYSHPATGAPCHRETVRRQNLRRLTVLNALFDEADHSAVIAAKSQWPRFRCGTQNVRHHAALQYVAPYTRETCPASHPTLKNRISDFREFYPPGAAPSIRYVGGLVRDDEFDRHHDMNGAALWEDWNAAWDVAHVDAAAWDAALASRSALRDQAPIIDPAELDYADGDAPLEYHEPPIDYLHVKSPALIAAEAENKKLADALKKAAKAKKRLRDKLAEAEYDSGMASELRHSDKGQSLNEHDPIDQLNADQAGPLESGHSRMSGRITQSDANVPPTPANNNDAGDTLELAAMAATSAPSSTTTSPLKSKAKKPSKADRALAKASAEIDRMKQHIAKPVKHRKGSNAALRAENEALMQKVADLEAAARHVV